jgi:hypothetical protein
VGEIYLLPTFHDLLEVVRMEIGEFDFPGQIVGISKLKEDEVFVSEIILDPPGLRSDDGFAQGQLFKNPRRRV